MIFVYYCEICEKEIEQDYPIGKAEERPICPDCGKTKTRRVFIPMNFTLKGGGTYAAEKRKESIIGKEMYAKYRYEDSTR